MHGPGVRPRWARTAFALLVRYGSDWLLVASPADYSFLGKGVSFPTRLRAWGWGGGAAENLTGLDL